MLAATERGPKFEGRIARLLCSNGFRVKRNAKAARPRQTDLYAIADDLSLLVEVKDRKRKIDTSDIDALRSRLRRTATDVVGAIFTTSDLTQEATRAIEAERTREVIVFVKHEIDQLESGQRKIWALISRKREELRVQGRVWIGSASGLEFVGVSLPVGGVEFRLRGKGLLPYFQSRTRNASVVNALAIPDSGWGASGGEGAILPLRLDLSTTRDLRDILGYLHKNCGLSNNGTFSIHQSDACWHGIGAEKFLLAVETWRERYDRGRLKRVHHSEECFYFDEFRSGWLLISTQQRIGFDSSDRCFLHQSELAIQLPGVPVDMTLFVDLCRHTGNGWSQFEFIGRRLTHSRRLKAPIELDIVGLALSEPEFREPRRIVRGVVAKNPFFDRSSLPDELQCEEMAPLVDLPRLELILCDLKDQHEEGDVADRYVLKGFEVTQAHVALIIRPICTWNSLLKRGGGRIER